MASEKNNNPAHEDKVGIRELARTEHVNEKCDEESCKQVHWKTGFWKRFLWLGALAILTMALCIAMNALILGTSHRKFREEWPAHQRWSFVSNKWKRKSQVEPHVLLAVVNSVTNIALTIAIGHGVAIAWWRRLLKGSTIAVSRVSYMSLAKLIHHRIFTNRAASHRPCLRL
jgi:hypothetical protein